MSAMPEPMTVAAKPMLPPDRVTRTTGYGFTSGADSYLYRPTSVAEIREIFDLARANGRQVTLRGAGRSYGDANIGAETVMIDLTRMRQILSWDKATGIIDCEAGVTIEGLWRHVIEDGYWPPVVSGTMFPTLGGALAMNIHGKNNFAVGTLGDQLIEIDFLLPDGKLLLLTQDDPLFSAAISSFGMLGVITRVKLKMKKVASGDLNVLPLSAPNWEAQFKAFESLEKEADYMVSWVDCFARGPKAGRGLLHAAWYSKEDADLPATLKPEHQDLPDTILGLVPKSIVWRVLKQLCNRPGMRFLNWGKHTSSKLLGNGKPHPQSLVGFSFLLDYVPNWRNAYKPGGFIQYQCFVPKEAAKQVLPLLVDMQQQAKLESFLGVMKRHRPDKYLFSHAVDGYSLALDFKVTKRNWPRLQALCHQMNDVVLKSGGRFYFAKDSTLRPADVRAYMGDEALTAYRSLKKQLDPDSMLTSELAKRLELA